MDLRGWLYHEFIARNAVVLHSKDYAIVDDTSHTVKLNPFPQLNTRPQVPCAYNYMGSVGRTISVYRDLQSGTDGAYTIVL